MNILLIANLSLKWGAMFSAGIEWLWETLLAIVRCLVIFHLSLVAIITIGGILFGICTYICSPSKAPPSTRTRAPTETVSQSISQSLGQTCTIMYNPFRSTTIPCTNR